MKNIELPRGEFVVYKGQLYHTKSYIDEYELFDLQDKERINVMYRITKQKVDDSYTAFSYCDYKGVQYCAYKIENDMCYFKKIVSNSTDELCCIPLYDITEVWTINNRKN